MAHRDCNGTESESATAVRGRARVHLGPHAEIDVTAYETDTADSAAAKTGEANGGVATAVWAPPRPTLDLAVDLPEQDEYEVRVYDTQRHRRLVAAVEIISPANKDRPEHRRTFVAKCAALLQQHVSIVLVDLVTTRRFNLYVDLLDLLGQVDPSLAPEPPVIYAAACRWARGGCQAFPCVDSHPCCRSATAALAVVAGRKSGRAPGAGSNLRGDLPNLAHPVILKAPNRRRWQLVERFATALALASTRVHAELEAMRG